MHVESITLVTPGGELRRASRTAHRELFALVAGGQGLFGALYSVTLDIGSLQRAVNEAAAAEVIAEPEAGSASRPLRLLLPPDKARRLRRRGARTAAPNGACRSPASRCGARRQEQDSFLRWARREYAAVTLRLAAAAGARRRGAHDAAAPQPDRRGDRARRQLPVSCTPEATRAQAEACYPQLRAFLAEKRRMDPAEKLTNTWYRHYRDLLSRKGCAVRWAR